MNPDVDKCDWYSDRLEVGWLGIVLGARMITTRERPGPFYRRQLFTLLTIWCEQVHPMSWQRTIENERDKDFFDSIGGGEYVAKPALFDWTDEHYPGCSPVHEPLPRNRFNCGVSGRLPGTSSDYDIRYVHGHLAEITVSAGGTHAVFQTWKEARRWLVGRRAWVANELDDERAENVFERYIHTLAVPEAPSGGPPRLVLVR